jgi:hypothetical protein
MVMSVCSVVMPGSGAMGWRSIDTTRDDVELGLGRQHKRYEAVRVRSACQHDPTRLTSSAVQGPGSSFRVRRRGRQQSGRRGTDQTLHLEPRSVSVQQVSPQLHTKMQELVSRTRAVSCTMSAQAGVRVHIHHDIPSLFPRR